MKNIIIVDDFYPNPDSIRNYALNAEYEKLGGRNWPGRDSVNEFHINGLMEQVSNIVGEPLTTKPCNKSSYFRMTKENEYGSQDIHFDPNPGLIWAGVCYLTPTEHLQGGTKFWRHNEYGWEQSPSLKEGVERGIANNQEMKKFFETDGKDHTKWTEMLNVPFRYNRLILFRPWLFHSNGELFGTTDENARLVQLFFFHSAT
jgi:hypothetical protein